MTRFAVITLGIGLGIVSSRAAAQSPPRAPTSIAVGDVAITPVIDLRLRGEARHDPPDMGGLDVSSGVVTSRVRGAIAGLERARLGALVDGGNVRGRVVLEDARVLGTSVNEGAFGPFEAWMEARTNTKRAWVRAGRQQIVWGDGLLLGEAEFAPAGRALDALRAQGTFGAFEVDVFASILVATRPATPSFGETQGPFGSGAQLYAARGAWTLDPLLEVELFAFARVARTGDGGSNFAVARGEGESYTPSLRVSGGSQGWGYGVEGAYQVGRVERLGGESRARAAWALFARGEKTFESTPLVPRVRIGASYASGDANDGGKYTQFDPILPDVHTHFGAMNAFAWSNTMQAHLLGGIQPWTDATLAIEYRYVRMADERGDWLNGYLAPVGSDPANTNAELGHELDVTFGVTPWPALDLRAGYAGVLWGDGARTILARQARGSYDPRFNAWVPADTSHFGYVQARVKWP